MTDEIIELKLNNLEENTTKIQKNVESMPDSIIQKLEATMNLKIENAIQKVKIDFYKWLVPIILGLLFNLIGVIFSFIKG